MVRIEARIGRRRLLLCASVRDFWRCGFGCCRGGLVFAIPAVLGFAVAVKCMWDFGWAGHGTPAPIAAPQRLVVVGFYRYVRNPMYVGFFAGWCSLWAVYGEANRRSLIVALVALAIAELFVRLYEEPTLRAKFGADYEEYCRNVPRWIPRLRAWKPAVSEF